MKIYDLALLNLILLVIPLMIYLLYTAYNNILDKKENNLIFNICLFSECYLIIKYGISLYKNIPLFIINIPLLIAYYKNKKSLIIYISIICIYYYFNYYSIHLSFIIFEYLLYFFLFIIDKKLLTTLFPTIKCLSIILLSKSLSLEIISGGIILFLLSSLTIYLLEKGEEKLDFNYNYQKIKKESKIKKSLFQITHEIKNPIAVCKGYLDMYDPNNPEKIKKNIPVIKEEIERTLILLEDFLEMNTQKINKEILDINFLLEEVTNNMKMLFKNQNIKLESNIPEDEVYINADYNRLTQVFINIFKNSIEALEDKNNKKIMVMVDKKEDIIQIKIIDNGIGIPKNIIEKIKEPFYTTKQKGTGLGVSLSNEIIKAHGGTINYESKENDYTAVTVKLPLEKAI
ncbi:MAG: HAMP domain-containing histidine kinase [Bacilli bacterium]|nr:HAMP domain-containing histidine kinase [Bacilli bacterium]